MYSTQKVSMSTTIYNAVRFNPGMNLSEVVKWCMELRPLMQNKAYQKDVQELLSTAVRIYDHKMLEKLSWCTDSQIKDNTSAFMVAFRQIDDEERDGKKIYGSKSESIIVFPHGRSIYALVRVSDAEELINTFTKGGIWKDFSYWNNSDRPDDVTSTQWSRRKNVWDEIFAESSIPADVGININMLRTDQKILNYQKFFDQLRSSIEQKQPFIHEGTWPRTHQRVVAMSNMVQNAPWFAEYLSSNQSLGVFSRIAREIEKGENELFNQARPFLEQYAIDPLKWEDLWVDFDNLQEHFDAKRTHVFTQDVPFALQTPGFQNAKLNHILPDNSMIKKAKI